MYQSLCVPAKICTGREGGEKRKCLKFVNLFELKLIKEGYVVFGNNSFGFEVQWFERFNKFVRGYLRKPVFE